jgi:hypothetical protein
VLRRQARALFFEAAKNRRRLDFDLLRCFSGADIHILLASSSSVSLSSPTSLQRARAVQAKIFPLSSSCRQPPLLAQQSPENLQELWPDQPSTVLYTDASGTTGWGSVLEPPHEATRSRAGWWVSQEVLEMMVLKELKACRHGLHQNVEASVRSYGQALPGQPVRLWSVTQNVIQMPSTHDRDQGPRTLSPRQQDPSRRGLHS